MQTDPHRVRAGREERARAVPAPGIAQPEGLAGILGAIRWARLTFTYQAEDALRLPPYAGSTFRGAFGHAFKRVACPLRRECEECAHRTVCVYVYVFETEGADGGSSLARSRQAAHPFVLDLPESPTGDVPPGGELELGLVLVGRAIPLAPYFLAACREMGRRGLGRGRGRARLVRGVAADPETPGGRPVYEADGDLMAPAVPIWSAEGLGVGRGACPEEITLEFMTPTRLRQDADLVVRPDFTTLATALLRRVSVLAEVHCDHRSTLDARAYLAQATGVKTTSSDLRWHDWERYSARQDARMALGGLVGRITFTGPLAPWLPLLRLGEVLHVGKGTAFGLGRYRIDRPCS